MHWAAASATATVVSDAGAPPLVRCQGSAPNRADNGPSAVSSFARSSCSDARSAGSQAAYPAISAGSSEVPSEAMKARAASAGSPGCGGSTGPGPAASS